MEFKFLLKEQNKEGLCDLYYPFYLNTALSVFVKDTYHRCCWLMVLGWFVFLKNKYTNFKGSVYNIKVNGKPVSLLINKRQY